VDRLPTVHARSNEGRGHPATPLIDRRTRVEVRQRLFFLRWSLRMNAKTATGAAGLTRRELLGSTVSLDGATALTAAAQSAFLSGRPDARIDI
jgi:hypothetical protein